jgi:hypothetical protein
MGYRGLLEVKGGVGNDDEDIAALFNRDGLTSSTGKPFTAAMISWIRFKHRIPGPSCPAGTLTVNEVCERYGVSMHVVYYRRSCHDDACRDLAASWRGSCTVDSSINSSIN